MIPIMLEEGEVFDRFSILAVKAELFPSEQNNDNLLDLFNIIKINVSNHKEIFDSKEYKELKKINLLIFETIEKIREQDELETDFCSAAWLDSLNTVRSLKRNALHEKFFGSTKEFKT